VLHAILDFIVDGYLPIVEAIEEEVLETEQRTLDAFLEREEIGRLFTLRRELIRFQRVLGPMHEVCNKLTHVSLPALDREVRPYFQDVLDHVRRHCQSKIYTAFRQLRGGWGATVFADESRTPEPRLDAEKGPILICSDNAPAP
jgi:hypothetical protein